MTLWQSKQDGVMLVSRVELSPVGNRPHNHAETKALMLKWFALLSIVRNLMHIKFIIFYFTIFA